MDEAKENCGVAAVSISTPSKNHPFGSAAYYLYKLLLQQQHRGQLSAGITTYNSMRPQLIDTHKDNGRVNDVFHINDEHRMKAIFKRYAGTKGIGHVRYATCGANSRSYAQPFERHHGRRWKWFGFAFNGNIANYLALKKELQKKEYHFVLDCDTEVMMHFLAYGNRGDSASKIEDLFAELGTRLDGAYNIVYVNAEGELAIARDPFGIRPLSIGSNEKLCAAASEDAALNGIGLDKTKSVEPGCVLIANGTRFEKKRFAKSEKRAHCMFEWVYFSNPASTLEGVSVYEARYKLGELLAKKESLAIDKDTIVVSVPDTARPAADAMAFSLGVPAQEGLLRNRYVGRTFIEGNGRYEKAKDKYCLNKKIVSGKKIILVEDSIVRGTTTRAVVNYLKEEGNAKEVHVRVSCPPIMFPCFYGIDMSTFSELIARKFEKEIVPGQGDVSEKTETAIGKEISADSLKYQTIDCLVKGIGIEGGKNNLCTACLDGNYPTEFGKCLVEKAKEDFHNGTTKRAYE